MQVQHMGYRIRGFYRVASLGHLGQMTPQDAQERLKILKFFDTHGLAATQDAFGVSRRTLFRLKTHLARGRGQPSRPGGTLLCAQAPTHTQERCPTRG